MILLDALLRILFLEYLIKLRIRKWYCEGGVQTATESRRSKRYAKTDPSEASLG